MNISTMRGSSRFARDFFIAFLFIFMLSMTAPVVSYAAESWRPEDSEALNIYESPDAGTAAEQAKEGAVSKIGDFVLGLLDTVLGAIINPFLLGIGNTINAVLLMGGISLDSMVYGRVGGMAAATGGVSLFQFDLTKGNTYGIVTMYLYKGLMYSFFAIFIATVLMRLCRLLFVSNDGKTRSELKSTLVTALLGCGAVFLMPKLVDLILWIKDIILYGIMFIVGDLIKNITASVESLGTAIGTAVAAGIHPVNIAISVICSIIGPGGEYSITEMYRKAAEGGDIFCSLMYIGSCIITIIFAVSYVATAFSIAIMFIFFPITCAIDMFGGGTKHMREWANEMLGMIIIPVIDAILLIFPIAFGILGSANTAAGPYTLIQFIMLAMIIPTRTAVRKRLGFQVQNGAELAGLGALLAVGKMGASLATGGASLLAGRKALLGFAGKKSALGAMAAKKGIANNAAGKSAAEEFGQNVDGIYEHANLKGTGYERFDAEGLERKMDEDGLKSSVARNAARSDAIKNNIDQAGDAKRNVENMRDSSAKEFDDKISGKEGEIKKNNQEISKHEKQRDMYRSALDMMNAKERSGAKPTPEDMAKKAELSKGINSENREIGKLNRANSDLRSDIGKLKTQKAETAQGYNNQIGKLGDIQRAGKEEIQKLKPIGGDTDMGALEELEDSVTLDNYNEPEIRKQLSPEKYAAMAALDAGTDKAQADALLIDGVPRAIRGAALGAGAGGAFGVGGAIMGVGNGVKGATAITTAKVSGAFETRRTAMTAPFKHVVPSGRSYAASQRTVSVQPQIQASAIPAATVTASSQVAVTAAQIPSGPVYQGPRVISTDTSAGEVVQMLLEEHPEEMECINNTAFAMGSGKVKYLRQEHMNGNWDAMNCSVNEALAHEGASAHAEASFSLLMQQDFIGQYNFTNPAAFRNEYIKYMTATGTEHYAAYVNGGRGATGKAIDRMKLL